MRVIAYMYRIPPSLFTDRRDCKHGLQFAKISHDPT
jgi:hypothetical protein